MDVLDTQCHYHTNHHSFDVVKEEHPTTKPTANYEQERQDQRNHADKHRFSIECPDISHIRTLDDDKMSAICELEPYEIVDDEERKRQDAEKVIDCLSSKPNSSFFAEQVHEGCHDDPERHHNDEICKDFACIPSKVAVQVGQLEHYWTLFEIGVGNTICKKVEHESDVD